MQPAGGVDEQDIDAAAFRRLHAVEDHRRGIGAGLMFDDIDADVAAPGVELLDGGGAESIAGDQQYFFAIVAVLGGEFADGGGLADAVDAEKNHHPGTRRKPRSFWRRRPSRVAVRPWRLAV